MVGIPYPMAQGNGFCSYLTSTMGARETMDRKGIKNLPTHVRRDTNIEPERLLRKKAKKYGREGENCIEWNPST
jgi:hypothetical protein